MATIATQAVLNLNFHVQVNSIEQNFTELLS